MGGVSDVFIVLFIPCGTSDPFVQRQQRWQTLASVSLSHWRLPAMPLYQSIHSAVIRGFDVPIPGGCYYFDDQYMLESLLLVAIVVRMLFW